MGTRASRASAGHASAALAGHRTLLGWLSAAAVLTACASSPSIDSADAPQQGVELSENASALLFRGDTCTTATLDGHSYWFCPGAFRSWVDAQSKCTALGAQLARVDSPNENEFVRHNVTADSWLSANDRSVEGRWLWGTAEQFSAQGAALANFYAQWKSGEPNDFLGEDCGIISTTGKWSDVNCVLPKGYVCEGGVDACPFVPAKTQPGECGCALPDVDADGDGVSACFDQCPTSAAAATLGTCGCPNAPQPSGTACADGLMTADKTCDGSGNCGRQDVCSSNPLCVHKTRGLSEYEFCHQPVTMAVARTKCQALGMDLVTIEGSDEDAFLYSQGHLLGLHWIGAQALSSGTWTWAADGTVFWQNNAPVNGKYRNWLPTQPSLALGQCAVRDDLTGMWTTVPCGASAGYICELSDQCPNDSNKRQPGQCGCGHLDVDNDGDGVLDCKALAQLNDEPGTDPCLLTVGARPQIDTSIAAHMFMDKVITVADYLAVSIDRTDKREALSSDISLCRAIAGGDRDGDLVPDALDQCPATPPITPTDAVGCTDTARSNIPNGDAIRSSVLTWQVTRAKAGVCEDAAAPRTPELVSGYIDNSQLLPDTAVLFFNWIPRSCPGRMRVEVYTDDPNGFPYGGGNLIHFDTGTSDFATAVADDGTVIDGVVSLVLQNSNFGAYYRNVWSEMADSHGNTAFGSPVVYPLRARAMAVYGDAQQSEWSNAVELRTIGDRQ